MTPPPDDETIPRQSLWALLPRRSLVKVAFLLALLLIIVMFQRRAEVIARHMTGALAPVPPSTTAPSTPAATPTTQTKPGRP